MAVSDSRSPSLSPPIATLSSFVTYLSRLSVILGTNTKSCPTQYEISKVQRIASELGDPQLSSISQFLTSRDAIGQHSQLIIMTYNACMNKLASNKNDSTVHTEQETDDLAVIRETVLDLKTTLKGISDNIITSVTQATSSIMEEKSRLLVEQTDKTLGVKPTSSSHKRTRFDSLPQRQHENKTW